MSEKNNFEMLDIINILGFAAQISNISSDEKEQEWIRKLVVLIAEEIEKLHKENDIIISKQNEIIKKLDKI